MEAIDRLARRQYGIVTRRQLLELGLSSSMISRWLAAGRLVIVQPRVFRLAGAPDTWEARLLAACFSGGAVASGPSGCRLWGMYDGDDVHVAISRGRMARLQEVIVHRSGDLHLERTITRHGIPTTTPMRALIDLGATHSAVEVEEALDRGLVARLFRFESVERALEKLAKPGRSGAGVLRAVLDDRALRDEVPDSLFEPRMARLFHKYGLPMPVFQYDVKTAAGIWIARVDFAYPDLKIAIEVDGWRSRATPGRLDYDLARQNKLTLAGWIILRFSWRAVVRRPWEVADEVSRALGIEITA